MNCAICRGACCESVTLGFDMDALPLDTRRWVLLHVEGVNGQQMTFPSPCKELTAEGRCGIYDDRPTLCQVFAVGGPECLTTVKVRRTPTEYALIRDAGDPERLHG